MARKTPPVRKGTAINNPERHEAAAGLTSSAKRYIAPKIQPLANDASKPNFRRTKPIEKTPVAQSTIPSASEGQGAEPSAPIETADIAIPKAHKTKADALKRADPTDRSNQAYAVRLLPKQIAMITDIAAHLNKDERYAYQIIQRKVKESLNKHRDDNAWGALAEEAKHRIDDPHGEGINFFKSVFRITDTEFSAMKIHIDDPMDMFTGFRITSAFAKVVLRQELNAIHKTTR